MKPLVIVESPYKGDVESNEKYARRCMFDSLNRGEAPFLSHALYTQCLDDTLKEERKLGMEAGWEWIRSSDYTVVYVDYGISDGMQSGIELANQLNHKIIKRKIGKNNKKRS